VVPVQNGSAPKQLTPWENALGERARNPKKASINASFELKLWVFLKRRFFIALKKVVVKLRFFNHLDTL
jgi:hypothetical protein